jgi:Tol biopolymer transport system component
MRRREAVAWLFSAVLGVGLVAALLTSRRTTETAPSSIVRFQVTPPEKTFFMAAMGAPDGSNSGTISPDGSMLAFVATDDTGKTLLWIRPLDSLAARALPTSDGASFPFWSPDSRYLGFFTPTRLKKIAPEGGPAQTLFELQGNTPRGGTWNRQGVILFATAGSPIVRISADGGPTSPVTAPNAESSSHQWPLFLPDDEHFLYYSAGARAVFVASLASGTIKKVTASDTNAILAPPGQMLFVRESTLFSQAFDTGRLELAGEPKPVVEQISWSPSPWNLAAASASATGTLTYRVGSISRNQIAWLDRSGRILLTAGPPGDYLSPALSPDETRVAFTRRDDQLAGDIWIMDLARQTRSRVTFDPGSDIYPIWSNDGSRIYYQSLQLGIVATSVTGTGAPERLLHSPSNAMLIPSQALAGNRLLFFGDFGGKTGFDTYVMPVAPEAKAAPLLQNPFSDVEAQMSPDEKWIAYAATETGIYEVFVQPVPATGRKWQISNGGGRQPMWRRDGRELFFVTNDRKFYSVEVRAAAEFEFGEPRFLYEMPANTVSVRNSYVPSRDGQRFLVNRQLDTTVPPINVVVNWQEELRQRVPAR